MNDTRPANETPSSDSARVGQNPANRPLVFAIAAAGALVAAFAGTHPTGSKPSDVVVTMCFCAAVALAAAVARPPAWAAASALAAVTGNGSWAVPALAAFGLSAVCLALVDVPKRPIVGALIGALDAQTLVRLSTGRHIANVGVTALAVGMLVLPERRVWLRLARTALVRRIAVGLVIASAAATAVFALSALHARHAVEVGMDRARSGISAAREGDSTTAARFFDEAADSFRSAHGDFAGWWAKPASLLPGVGQQAKALDVLSDSGVQLARAAATSARAADIQSLRVHDGRLDLDRVRSMGPPLAQVLDALHHGDDAIARAESSWLLPPVAHRLEDFAASVQHAEDDAETASLAVDVLPDLLGATTTRHYFVAFATPAETRDLGGFMGAYGLLTAKEGKISLDVTGRVRDLNRAGRGRVLTDSASLPDRYRSMGPDVYWQDVTGTSDFPTVSRTVGKMWPQSGGGQLDGVLYLDPGTLAALLKLTGPVLLPDYDVPIASDNAEQFLYRDQYRLFPNEQRHDFLVEAAETVFKKLTTGDLPEPRVIADALAPKVDERRLLLHSFHDDEERLFERLHADGSVPPVNGDFLSVRSSNHGLSKIDAYMQRVITDDVVIDPLNSSVQATVTVTIRNRAPASGLPIAVIGNRRGQPRGTNSTTIAVMSPLKIRDVTQSGQSVPRGAFREYARWVYTTEVNVPAGGEVTVQFHLEGLVDLTRGYRLDVVPQPLTDADELNVHLGAVRGFRLDTRPIEGLRQRTVTHLEAAIKR